MHSLFTLTLLFQTFFLFGQPTDSLTIDNKLVEGYQWRTLEADAYSIQYPLDWIADKSEQLGAELFLFSPKESKGDQFIESINLVVSNLAKENSSFEKYIQQSENELKSMITNYKLLEKESLTNQNGAYQKLIYTGDHNKHKLKFIKYFLMKNKKAYVLTYTGEQSNFDKYSKKVEKIWNSFIVK